MAETMGQIIKRLRKERNFTQEELAEQLGVTFQAVSKWENDTGMPDISQVVPLASVFEVSTDVLFGLYGKNCREEVEELLGKARSMVPSPATKEAVLQCYRTLTEGLAKYPNNTALLMGCLEAGLSLAFPENDTYDNANGKQIYRECIHFADLVIKYGRNTNDVMRARMIMVLLHSAYGNGEAAGHHAAQFPRRADMTAHTMESYIAHFEKDTQRENRCYQTDLVYHLVAMLDDLVAIGFCYFRVGQYEETRSALTKALELIELLFGEEEVLPSFHLRERGDIYVLLAQLSLKEGDTHKALTELEQSVDLYFKGRKGYRGQEVTTPLFRLADCRFFHLDPREKGRILARLTHPVFAPLKTEERYRTLLERVESDAE
ncbi:MAG: helix-turn-helix transcriptional regulator [Clostridia bacterium]|nr:helix-turn-helix transcriptional regulator [Clostridia bacterium]